MRGITKLKDPTISKRTVFHNELFPYSFSQKLIAVVLALRPSIVLAILYGLYRIVFE